jgi:hypothetical protein
MVRVLREIELSDPENGREYPQYQFHNQMLMVYHEVKAAGISELRDKLLKPYNETVVSQFKYDEYAHDMMITSKNIIFIISEIKLDAEQYAATFELIQKNLSESIDKLDQMIAQMKTSVAAST